MPNRWAHDTTEHGRTSKIPSTSVVWSRTDAKATIATARRMGIEVKMVTGDALAIATETAKGLGMGTKILDAASLGDATRVETDSMSHAIEAADGYAQVFPEHKYHIVDVLQRRGHIVV